METKNKNYFNGIKSNYILKQIFNNLDEYKTLQILKYNYCYQKKLNLSLDDYIDYKKIHLEIIPINIGEENTFINFPEEHKSYFHIYFNNDEKEANKNYFTNNEKVTKVKIVIDNEITSLNGLFRFCECIEKLIS